MIQPYPSAEPDLRPPVQEANLRDYLQVLRKRRAVVLQVGVLVFAVTVVITLLAKPVYETRAKLVVPQGGNNVNLIDTSSPINVILQAAQPDSLATQLEVLQSQPFQAEAAERAGLKPKPGVMSPVARIAASPGASVIEITAEGGDPADTRALANAIVQLHRSRMREVMSGGLDRTVELVRNQVSEAKKALDRAEAELVRFRARHRVVEAEARQQADTREYVDLRAKMREAESNVTTTEAQIRELERQIRNEPVDLVEENTRDNPRIEKLQARLDELRFQRSDLLRDFRETSRQVRAIDGQIAELEGQIRSEPATLKVRTHKPNPNRPPLVERLAELRADLRGYQAALAAAKARFEERQGLVDDLGPWQVELARLEADRDAAQKAYYSQSERLRDLETRATIDPTGVRVLEWAPLPTRPARPNRTANLLFGALLALCLGAGIAFLQEYLDDRVNSPEDLERLTALPALGHVPYLPADQPRVMSALSPHSQAAESYRGLRTSIGFAGIDTPMNLLQVTSGSKGEGKTLTAVNLAAAMALDGKQVILLDADLRKPSIHRVLRLDQSPGLADLLAGSRRSDEVLQSSEVQNLRVITSGPIPPNPAELLGSRRFDEVLAELEAMADVVIVDSPPCVPVSDPLLIAARMHGVIVVVQSGQTRKAAVRHVESLLRRAHARIVGMVFNRTQPGRHGYYYQDYYYYYGHGYYGEPPGRAGSRRNGKRRSLPRGNGAPPVGLGGAQEPEE